MRELFFVSPSLIIFLHVLSAIIWVGGMITMRFVIHYSMNNIIEPKIKIERTLENLKRFFNLMIVFIFILLITAIIMILGLSFKGTPLYHFVLIKEAIWMIMTGVFIFIYIKRNKAQKAYNLGDMLNAKLHLESIAKYYIPINIALGLLGLYFGITLRGF